LDAVNYKQEWIVFKEVMIKAHNMTCSKVMKELLLPNYSLAYPLLSKLAGSVLSLPVSMAACERGFSAMKRSSQH